MRRPALKTALGFCAGIILGYFTEISLSYISFFLLGTCVFYLIFGILRSKVLNPLIFIIIGISGMFWYEMRTTVFPENHIENYLSREKVKVISKIVKDPDLRIDKTILECDAESLDEQVVTGKVRITLKYPAKEFEYGDRIETYGRFWESGFPRNPESFDYREWLKRRNIYAAMNIWESGNIRIIDKGSGNPIVSKVALPIKRSIRNTIDEHLGWIQGAFLKGIVIRERGFLPDRIQEYFRNTGVIHILAVSGLHIGIIAFIIFILLSVFRIPLIPKQILTSIFLILYAFMIDLRMPVVRATIMTILGMIAITAERDTDALNVISFAVLFILFLNPQALFDVSFQLSFGAVLSIVYLYPKIYDSLFGRMNIRNRVAKYLLKIFVVSLCVQIGLAPLIAYYFWRVPIISIIANVFVIPLTGVCIALTFAMSIFNFLPWEFLGNIFACANWGATTFTLTIIEWFNRVPYGHFWVGKPFILLIGFLYLFILSIVNLRTSKPARKVFIYGLLLSANVLLWSGVYKLSHPMLKVTYLDVGHGDCVFIEMPRGHKILIDGGPWKWGTWFNAGEKIVTPFLRAKGVKTLDLVVAISPKIYRIGGIRYIIDNFKVKEFVCPAVAYSSKSWLRLLELLEYKDIPCSFVDADNVGLVLEYGALSFRFPGDTRAIRGAILKEGAIIATTDGNTLEIETMRSLSSQESLKHRLLRYCGMI
ncbi:ComEC/Rec2 family competence protein [candidate division WOR-3 bacterium]|nr:ComEC/Rec2 family competence protein [candidate division WOR-3 bacterium]